MVWSKMKKLLIAGLSAVSLLAFLYFRYADVFKTPILRSQSTYLLQDGYNHGQQMQDIKRIFLATNDATVTATVNNGRDDVIGQHDFEFDHSQNITSKYKKYAILGVSTPFDENYNYVFIVPLTVLSWQRIGYSTIVFIAGSEAEWKNQSVLATIYRYLLALNSTIHFLTIDPKHRVMTSQVSRLFAASVLRDQLDNDDYLVTSDSDLWPLDASMYELHTPFQILSTNSDCCGDFRFNGTSYKMLPMCSIGANTVTWLDLLATEDPPKTAPEILSYFERRFGNGTTAHAVQKGENAGWFSDQRMVSILVHEWIAKNDRSLVNFKPRDVSRDRIDRSWWRSTSLVNKTDAHLLENAYNYKTWFQLTPLLRQMYGEDSPAFRFSMQYFEVFLDALKRHNVNKRLA